MLADGAALPGVLAADVLASSALRADRFRARFAAQAVDAAALERPGMALSIEAAVGDGAWVRLITGRVDSVAFEMAGRTLEIEGRDLGAVLVDAPAGEVWANQTASEIVEAAAARHGLQFEVTGTTTPVGRYEAQGAAGHELLALPRHAAGGTAWDVLAWLALQEGFLLGMAGERLRFAPRSGPAVHLDAAGCEAVSCERALPLLRPIEVTVRSWDARRGAAVMQVARAEGTGPAWQVGVQRPNLDTAGAQRLAQRTLDDMRRHARTAAIAMPGELSLTVWDRVALGGAGGVWDGAYAVIGIDRHIDARHGFTQTVQLQGEA